MNIDFVDELAPFLVGMGIIVGCIIVGFLWVWRNPAPARPPCCNYVDHTEWCGCTRHKPSELHPFGEGR